MSAVSKAKESSDWDQLTDLDAIRSKSAPKKEPEREFNVKAILAQFEKQIQTRENVLGPLRAKVTQLKTWNKPSQFGQELFQLECELDQQELELCDSTINGRLILLKNELKLKRDLITYQDTPDEDSIRKLNREIQDIRNFQAQYNLDIKNKVKTATVNFVVATGSALAAGAEVAAQTTAAKTAQFAVVAIPVAARLVDRTVGAIHDNVAAFHDVLDNQGIYGTLSSWGNSTQEYAQAAYQVGSQLVRQAFEQ